MGKVKKVRLTLNTKDDILGDWAAKIERSVICKEYAITNATTALFSFDAMLSHSPLEIGAASPIVTVILPPPETVS